MMRGSTSAGDFKNSLGDATRLKALEAVEDVSKIFDSTLDICQFYIRKDMPKVLMAFLSVVVAHMKGGIILPFDSTPYSLCLS